jgi:hypothetical protein
MAAAGPQKYPPPRPQPSANAGAHDSAPASAAATNILTVFEDIWISRLTIGFGERSTARLLSKDNFNLVERI